MSTVRNVALTRGSAARPCSRAAERKGTALHPSEQNQLEELMGSEKIQSELKEMRREVRHMAPLRILCQIVSAITMPGMLASGFIFGAGGSLVAFIVAWAACILAGSLASYEYARTFTAPLKLPRTCRSAFFMSIGRPAIDFLLFAALNSATGYALSRCSVSGDWVVILSALGTLAGMSTALAAWFVPVKWAHDTLFLLKDMAESWERQDV